MNPFQTIIDKLRTKLVHEHTFIGIYVNKKKRMKILRDPATGKFVWYSSCSELYGAFINYLSSNTVEFKGCDFYAINASEYINNKLLINLYTSADVAVTHETLLPFRPVSLDFHRKASIAMYMPIKRNLDNFYEKVKEDPSCLFEIAQKAKDLVFNESKPCVSCGTVCHVPDVSHNDELSSEARTELMRLSEENRDFCFACGKDIVTSVANFKMKDCGDMHKVNTVNALIAEANTLDLTANDFDFDKAQNVIRQLMGHIAKTRMTIVSDDNIIREELNESQPIKEADITKSSQLPPWMN